MTQIERLALCLLLSVVAVALQLSVLSPASASVGPVDTQVGVYNGVLTVNAGDGVGGGRNDRLKVYRGEEKLCPVYGGQPIGFIQFDLVDGETVEDQCVRTGRLKYSISQTGARFPMYAVGGDCRQAVEADWKEPWVEPVTDDWVLINVRQSDSRVICNADGIGSINVQANGGDDYVRFPDMVTNERSLLQLIDIPVRVEGGPGRDVLFGAAASGDNIIGGPGKDVLAGGPGFDTVNGGPDEDYFPAIREPEKTEIDGNDRNVSGFDSGGDTIEGGDGCVEQCTGGEPQDTVDYSKSPEFVCVSWDSKSNDGAWDDKNEKTKEGDNVLASVENPILSAKGSPPRKNGRPCGEHAQDLRPVERTQTGGDGDDAFSDPPGPTTTIGGGGEDTIFTTTTTTPTTTTTATTYVTDPDTPPPREDPPPPDDPDVPDIPTDPGGPVVPPTTTTTLPIPDDVRPFGVNAWAPISGDSSDWLNGRGDAYIDLENVHGSPGRDRVYFATGNEDETYFTGGGNDIVITNGGADTIIGEGGGSTTVHAGSGKDWVEGHGSIASINGGSGSDLLFSESAAVSPGGHAAATASAAAAPAGTGPTVSIFGGLGDSADELYGWPGKDVLDGGGGDDTLFGRGGPDVLKGGTGAADLASYGTYKHGVKMSMGDGANDGAGCIDAPPAAQPSGCERADIGGDVENISGGAKNDHLIGNGGANELKGNAGNDLLDGGAGPDVLSGGGDHDTVSYATAGSAVKVTANDNIANDGQNGGAERDNMASGVEEIVGGPFNDDLTGSKVANVLHGNGGNDTLNGTKGKDDLYGEVGPNQALRGTPGQDTLYGRKGRDLLVGGPARDVLNGDEGKDELQGEAGPDELWGGKGIDTLRGGTEADVLRGENGGDQLFGDAGLDDLFGGPGSDKLFGGADADDLFGEEGGDKIDGEAGQDKLAGGPGKDKLLTRDGVRDELRCGKPKRDRAEADTTDYIAWPENPDFGKPSLPVEEACEKVSVASVPPPGPPQPNYVSRVAISSGTLTMHGYSGRTHKLEVYPFSVWSPGDFVLFSDLTGPVEPGPGCAPHFDGAVCPRAGVSKFNVWGADKNDSISINTRTALPGLTVEGRGGNDVLVAVDDNGAALEGGDGTDLMIAGFGSNKLCGGDGDLDTVWYYRNSMVVADIDGVADDGAPYFGGEKDNICKSVEVIAGSTESDTLTARQDVAPAADPDDDSVEGMLIGNAGNDTLNGGPTGDLLVDAESGPSSGNDRLNGGGGEDTLEGGDGNDALDGGSGSDELDGSDGDDTLAGQAGEDTLEGGAGADALTAGSEADELEGGSGNDSLDGGSGDDAVEGDSGDDSLKGGDGNDELGGGDGGDSLDGGVGTDEMSGENGLDGVTYAAHPTGVSISANGEDDDGGPGERDMIGESNEILIGSNLGDNIQGAEGTDIIVGLQGGDTIDAGDGNDVVVGDFLGDNVGDPDTIRGGTGNDQLIGQGGADQLFGGEDDDLLQGGDGNDTLAGEQGTDALNGMNDSDVLRGGDGPDSIDPGAGDRDRLDYTDQDQSVEVDLAHLSASGSEAGDGDVVKKGIDDITGGPGRDDLFGDSTDNRIDGGSGADHVDGDDGPDTVTGGPGVDTIAGGPGNDQLQAADGTDDGNLVCGPGSDTAVADPRPFEPGDACEDDARMNVGGTVAVAAGSLVYDARPGKDNNVTVEQVGGSILLADTGAPITATGSCSAVGANKVSCPSAGVQRLSVWLDDRNDAITSTLPLPAEINAGAGADFISTGPSNDQLNGGSGVDKLSYSGRSQPVEVDLATGSAGQQGERDQVMEMENVQGGSGNDNIAGDAGDNELYGGLGDDVMRGAGGSDRLDSGSGLAVLYGDEGDDVLSGGPADDIMFGGPGDDALAASDGVDWLAAGEGDDTVYGQAGADVVYGGEGGDAIQGGADDDNLYGSEGDDVISGDAGKDKLVGEGGSDRLYARDGEQDVLVCASDGEPDGLVNYFDKDNFDVFGAAHGCTNPL